MDKQSLRKQYKHKRLALTAEETDTLSKKICDQLIQVILDDETLVHSFLPMKKWNEVDTFHFIHHSYQHYPNRKIATSISDFNDGSLSHVLINPTSVFKESTFGILEPSSGAEIDLSEISVVLIPLLCCDMHGNRIGYGKGFYDRFLTQCKPETVFIGLSFFEPLAESISAESHDIPLNMLVTPQKVYTFNQ